MTGPSSSATDAPPLLARLAVAFLGLGSVLSLLAWVYEIAPFREFFLAVSMPLTLAMIAVGVLAARRRWTWWREAMVAGALGGFLGTFGYDIFRIPFYVAGFQVLAPIDSYGLLLLDAQSSSAWTGLTGWSYHFLNGVGFGVTYGVMAKGRHWGWGIAWALVLETATILTPFADSYALRGQWVPIAIAYGAHIPYGFAIGKVVQRAEVVTREAVELLRFPLVVVSGVLIAALAIWLRPWSTDPAVAAGRDAAPGPSAIVVGDRFVPLWMRAPVEDGCVTVRNDSDTTYGFASGSDREIGPGDSADVCFDDGGVHRVRLTVDGRERAHTGGFVLIDPEG
ncbi:MAG: hypothetical protein ACLGHT_13110 [Acidimicrobiia bacterium]